MEFVLPAVVEHVWLVNGTQKDGKLSHEATSLLRSALCKGIATKVSHDNYKTTGFAYMDDNTAHDALFATLLKATPPSTSDIICMSAVKYGETVMEDSIIQRQDCFANLFLNVAKSWEEQVSLVARDKGTFQSLLQNARKFGISDSRTYWTKADQVGQKPIYTYFNLSFSQSV
jgi:hypothetical protein